MPEDRGAAPVLIIAGLGRCGSSLVMQMLAKAGVACVGTFPDYEVEEVNHRAIDASWLREQAGRAVKILDPHVATVPAEVSGPVIWLDRNPREQARSQAKVARLMVGLPPASREHLRRWERGLAVERGQALRELAGRELLLLTYESLLRNPRYATARIAGFLAPQWQLDSERMMAAVRKHDPRCAPGLDMEYGLLAETEAVPPERGTQAQEVAKSE
jgi:hypothetical protein